MNRDGVSLLKILTLPDWNEKLLRALFKPEMRPKGYGSIEFDAYWNKMYIYSHLDSDIARLIRFREALKTQDKPFEVICFPWQVEFLSNYLSGSVRLKQIAMPAVLTALGIKE